MNKMAKTKGIKEIVTYLEGIENSVVEEKIAELIEAVNTDMTKQEALDVFVKKANSKHARENIDTPEKRLTYAIKGTEAKIKASRNVSSKPTMPISCVISSVGGVVQNYANVTDDTRDMKDKKDKIGLAGSWMRCLSCNRIWDTADPKYGTICPSCQNANSVILAYQAVPNDTQGIVNKNEMRTGDISVFNTTRTSIFMLDEEDNMQEAFLSLTGEKQKLLDMVQLGEPFDINVSEDVFYNETTGLNSYSTTGTSKVTACSNEDFPDILDIYRNMYSDVEGKSLIHSVAAAEDGTYCTFFLEVIEEAIQPKENGKWLIRLAEPVEDEDEEALVVSMYLDEEDIAKQLREGDIGIFECRYTEGSMTVEGVQEVTRTINVNVNSCGLPIYIMGDDGTKFISA